MAWVSPTGFNDPDDRWRDEANAYGDDIEAFAYQPFVTIGGFLVPRYLELTLSSPIDLSKVRIYCVYRDNALPSNHYDPDIRIDLYNGSWANIHDGIVTKQTWNEISAGGLIPGVTKARLIMNDTGTNGWWFMINEFDFHKVVGPFPTFLRPA